MQPRLITAPDAAKLPRAALLALCALYVLTGLLGRDPWSTDDAAGFGIARTMATGDWRDWLMPNVAGLAQPERGPLAFWIGAAFARLLPFLQIDLAVRLAAAAWLTAALAALWYAIYTLASRPDAQPLDPFGASPSRTDFGRAVADAGLLILLAMIGPLARVHETTVDSLQLALGAVFLFGVTHALQAPRAGGVVAGLAVGATVLTRGLPLAAALLAAGCMLPVLVRQYRLVARPMLSGLLAAALVAATAWPALMAASGPEGLAYLDRWGALAEPAAAASRARPPWSLLGSGFWFFWPAWPIAGWAVLAARGRLTEPATAVPLTVLVASAVGTLAGVQTSSVALLPLAPALAMLAAVGLPTLERRVVSLIDWFAVAAFTLFAVAMWAYWFAFLAGTPPRMAASIVRLAPGLAPRFAPLGFAFALAATLAWLLLARWRLSRQPRALWRSVALSAGGLVLAWSLLMSLWLPVFNYRKSYRDVAQQVGAIVPPDHRCTLVDSLPPAPRAGFVHFAGLTAPRTPEQAARCDWLLLGDRAGARQAAPAPRLWQPVWEGRRPADRGGERYRLYRRIR